MQKLTQKQVTDLYAESAHAMKAIIYKAFSSVDDRVLKLESRAGEFDLHGSEALEQLGEYGETIINRMNLIENRFNLSRIPVNYLHNDVLNSDNLMQACVPLPPPEEDRDLSLLNPVPAVSTSNSLLFCASQQMQPNDKNMQNLLNDSCESNLQMPGNEFESAGCSNVPQAGSLDD